MGAYRIKSITCSETSRHLVVNAIGSTVMKSLHLTCWVTYGIIDHGGDLMTLTLYTTTDPVNKCNKTITKVTDLTGTLRNNTDLINPVVDIEYASVTGFNYVYIDEFNRYYFVRSVKSMSNSLVRLELHVDVLKTYYSHITGLSGYVSRNANTYDRDIVDPLQPVSKGTNTEILEFSTQPFAAGDDPDSIWKDYHFVLLGMGGY